MASDLTCPFCGETDFDKVGLKLHLSMYGCEAYESFDAVAELQKERQPRHAEEDMCPPQNPEPHSGSTV